MSKNLNFRSKKGMSLAVSLVICLFLILVTGGITTVALIQHNETGSNMNTRQAYISAKSGLDVIQDALAEGKVDNLPVVDGDNKYYVFYYNSSGALCFDTETSEENARNLANAIATDPNKTIVGGEGTYFKISKSATDKLKVTALNVTGKYNANVSLNRGDLSFDAAIKEKYYVKLLKTPTDPPTPPPTDPPTPPTTDPTTPLTTEPSSALGGRFMMVGQQTCLNDTADPSGYSTGRTLNQYSKDNNQLFYIPYNENGASGYGYSYFPIVYDRMIKWTAENARASLTAVNEGIYLLGDGSGHKNVDEFYNGGEWDTEHTLNTVSCITQNAYYKPSFNCKFLCIENNFVTIADSATESPLIKYSGSDFVSNPAASYVVAYLPKEVTFYIVAKYEEPGKPNKQMLKQFNVPAGYYKINTGTEGVPICNENTWKTPLPADEVSKWASFNMYHTIISYYDNAGEIHSGAHETDFEGTTDDRIHITNNNGAFNTDQKPATGYSSTASFTYSNVRDNHNIFLAPNFAITTNGYYHWYCGRNFNFQWFRTFDLSVTNGAHVIMSAPSIVLTIGPEVTNAEGHIVKVSNKVVEQGTATWEFYGDKGTGAPQTLNVMCPFTVQYDGGKTYDIIQGSYVNVPSGLDLFSEEGKNYFLYTSDVRSISDPTVVIKAPKPIPVSYAPSVSSSKAVMPASINAQAGLVANLCSKLTNGFRLAPMAAYTVKNDGTGKATISTLSYAGYSGIKVPEAVTSLIYDDGTDDDMQRINVGTKVTIKKEIDGREYDFITFDATTAPDGGTEFRIPIDDTVDLDLLKPSMLISRQGDSKANYEVVTTYDSVVILNKYY